MKNKLFRRAAAALCALILALNLVPAAQAAATPAVSNNRFQNDYTGNYFHPIASYLYANPSGGLTRVELINKEIIVEDYSSSFALLSQRKIPMELSSFGGFCSGSQYNFIVFHATNSNESDSVEVMRVVKYDKNWNRLGQASVYGANSVVIARAGSMRFLEYGGMLYVYTCHEMYKSSDGQNHQANMEITVRESDMTVTEKNCLVSGYRYYTSHSFNQFIIADSEGNILVADHGDASPRALVIRKLAGKAGAESLRLGTGDQFRMIQSEKFKGNNGDNTTHTMMGGIAETSSGYVMAYAQRPDYFIGNTFQVYLSYISKSDFRTVPLGETEPPISFQTQVLTKYGTAKGNATCPVLAPTGSNGGWLMWNLKILDHREGYVNEGFYYTAYSADGSVGEVKTLPDVALSDCQPIAYNGKTVWYTTHNSAPTFYMLDASGVTAVEANGSPKAVTSAAPTPTVSGKSFTDLSSSHWAYEDIMKCVANGAVTGFDDGTFRPEDTITVPQFLIMLERVFYAEKLAQYQEKYAGKAWYIPVFESAGNILSYLETELRTTDIVDAGYISVRDKALDRFTMAMMAANVISAQSGYISSADSKPSLAAISDYSSSWPVKGVYGVPVCLYTGVMEGMPDGTFSGTLTVTRAQACAVLNRMIEYIG